VDPHRDLSHWVYVEAFARCFCQHIVGIWRKRSNEETQAIVDYFKKERTSQESRMLSAYWTDKEMASLSPVMSKLLESASALDTGDRLENA